MTILILAILILSWVLVFLLERKNILSLWLKPLDQRFKELVVGILFAAVLSGLTQLILGLISGTSWTFADGFTASKLSASLWYDFRSVLFEELLFRGVPLYLLLKYLNTKTGLLLSAVAFGIYHWFTLGVLGNPLAMALVFITTAWMGYVLAVAYSHTGSIILPFALHFGWNTVNHNVFSGGPNGLVLLQPDHVSEMTGWYAFFSFVVYLLVPLMMLLWIRSGLIKRAE